MAAIGAFVTEATRVTFAAVRRGKPMLCRIHLHRWSEPQIAAPWFPELGPYEGPYAKRCLRKRCSGYRKVRDREGGR